MAFAPTQASLEIQALLGHGTRYEGKLLFDGRVRIDGEFDGHVVSKGTLIVGPTAQIRGCIEVGSLIVCGGIVDAKVVARDSVELLAQSRVNGEIETPQLFVERGAVMEGHCNTAKVVTAFPQRPDATHDASIDVSGVRAAPVARLAPPSEELQRGAAE